MSNSSITTRISLGIVAYTILCVSVFTALTLWKSKTTFDMLIKKEVAGHFDVIYPLVGGEGNSLEKLGRYFETYQKRHHVDIALYNVIDGNPEVALSTFGNRAALDKSAYIDTKPKDCNVVFTLKEGKHLASCRSAVKNQNGDVIAVLEIIKNASYYDTQLFNTLKHHVALAVIMVLCSMVISRLISRSIIHPIAEVTSVMERMAKGESSVHIPFISQKDEMYSLMAALQALRENIREFERVTEIRAHEQSFTSGRQHYMEQSLREFDSSASSVIHQVTEAVQQLKAVAENASGSANQASQVIQQTLSTSTHLSSNVQTMAAAVGALSTSIQEIGRQVSHSINIAKQAVCEVTSTHQTVSGFSEAAQKIGTVVSTISDIAEQTNLLALNATIEAARAGDAGRGFAVVASEVKQLANQTEKATQEITAQIKAIQENSSNSVHAMQNVSKVIEEMDSISSVIALAIQGQAKATQEITRHVMEAADGAKRVNGNISNVADATNDTSKTSSQVVEVARRLFDQGQHLQSTIQSFLKRIHAERVV